MMTLQMIAVFNLWWLIIIVKIYRKIISKLLFDNVAKEMTLDINVQHACFRIVGMSGET